MSRDCVFNTKLRQEHNLNQMIGFEQNSQQQGTKKFIVYTDNADGLLVQPQSLDMPLLSRVPLTTWNGHTTKHGKKHDVCILTNIPSLREPSDVVEDKHSNEMQHLSDADFLSNEEEELPQLESAINAFLKWPSFNWQSDSGDSLSPPRSKHAEPIHNPPADSSEAYLEHSSNIDSPFLRPCLMQKNMTPVEDPLSDISPPKSSISVNENNNDSPTLKVWDLDDSPVNSPCRRPGRNSMLFLAPTFYKPKHSPSDADCTTLSESSSTDSISSPKLLCRKSSPRVSHKKLDSNVTRRPNIKKNEKSTSSLTTSGKNAYEDPCIGAHFVSSKFRTPACLPVLSEDEKRLPLWPAEWRRLEAEQQRLRNRLPQMYEERIGPFREVFEENRRLRELVSKLEIENQQVQSLVQEVQLQTVDALQKSLERTKQLEDELKACRHQNQVLQSRLADFHHS